MPDGSYGSYDDFVSTGNQAKSGVPPSVNIGNKPSDKPDDNKPSDKPDNPGDSGDIGGDSTPPAKPDNPDVTPPVTPSEPDFSIPDNADYAQLNQLYFSCVGQNDNYRNPHDSRYNPALDEAYNAHVDKCNAVYDKINNSFPAGGKFTLNKDSDEFLTKRFDGTMVRCIYQPHIGSDMGGQVLSRSAHREVIQHPDFPVYDPHNYPLDYNYPAPQPLWVDTLCETVADRPDSVNDLYNGKNPDNQPDNKPDNPGVCQPGRDLACTFVPDGPDGCPPGTFYYLPSPEFGNFARCSDINGNLLGKDSSGKPVIPGGGSGSGNQSGGYPGGTGGGSGSGNTDSDGNGDVAAAIDRFHQDNNASQQKLLDELKKQNDPGDGSVPGLPSIDVPELSLSPLWNIWPSARDFKLTLPAADCPVFTIDVWGKDYRIDTFCTLITPDIIAVIRTICILVASVISFIIVLRS
ncbi:hypothetical protein ABN789_001208 [Salmonella enterica]